MAKTNTVQIKLVSSADTGFFYVTKKNPRTKTNKLELKKYDPVSAAVLGLVERVVGALQQRIDRIARLGNRDADADRDRLALAGRVNEERLCRHRVAQPLGHDRRRVEIGL